MDHNLYFSTHGPITINASHPASCPLGEIVFAGTKWNSRATYAHAPPPDYMRPTPHYLLIYTLEGEADYRDDTGVKTILRKGSLVWTCPNVNQSYGPRPGQRWSEFFVWFGGSLFDTWRDQGFPGARSLVLSLDPVSYWLDKFRQVVVPDSTAVPEVGLVKICRFQSILAEALQCHEQNQEASEDTVWRETVCRRLRQGTLTSPTLEGIARSMKMSYTLFRQRFLALTGKSPGQFRSDEIMYAACRLLLENDDPVSSIAERLGFYDQFHFSRRFKQKIGLSPSNFRLQIK